MPEIKINDVTCHYKKGTTFEEAARDFEGRYDSRIALAVFNGKLCELNREITCGGELSFVTMKENAGHSAYVRTAQLILLKALSNLQPKYGKAGLKIEFMLGNGNYCDLLGNLKVSERLIKDLETEMRELVKRDLPITKTNYPKDEALELFRRQGMTDKEKVFHFRRESSINVYNLDGYKDYFYGYMLPSTGYVKLFKLQMYRDGLLMVLPTQDAPDTLLEFEDQESLFEQLALTNEWGELVGCSHVGDLNEHICDGTIGDLILVQEALQERRIGEIARAIYEKKDVKLVLTAGPSSSGKTTFSHRLAIQLRTFGMCPHIIGMDDYFVNREDTPVDENGNYNFDVVEAVDLELFRSDMKRLLQGETVEMPTFDFKSGKRVYKGNTMKLEESDVLLVEGIHGLNPVSTEGIPDKNKFKIYISALTSLNLDDHNRIPSTDVRLLRRMIRDARTRGNTADATLSGWKKVRDGEEKNIFPYQKDADVVFNSVLIYELSVLKQYAEPLLFNVKRGTDEYYEAKRLLKFLEYFVGVDTAALPANSLCREFIGGGCFGV